MDPSIIQRLLSQLHPDDVTQVMTEAQSGLRAQRSPEIFDRLAAGETVAPSIYERLAPVTSNPYMARQMAIARARLEGRRVPLAEIGGGFAEGLQEDYENPDATRTVGVMDPENTDLRQGAREAGRIANPLSWLPGSPTAIAKGLLAGGKGLNSAIIAATLKKGLTGEPGYVYHATNAERLGEIADTGKLVTHKPNYGTDQRVWPDGSTEKRTYFSASPENSYQFAPEEGRGVILRTKQGGHIFKESTGDLFARKPIDKKALEFLGDDNKWHSLDELTF